MEGTKVALTNTQAAADAGCRIDIRIESRGDVNIYNWAVLSLRRSQNHVRLAGRRTVRRCQLHRASACRSHSVQSPSRASGANWTSYCRANPAPSAIVRVVCPHFTPLPGASEPANSFQLSSFGLLRALRPDLRGILMRPQFVRCACARPRGTLCSIRPWCAIRAP